MPTVDYQLYAEAGDANVITQPTYVAAPWRLTGFVPGLAQSAEANKVWRQSAFMATALATFVSQQLGVDVLDDGNLSGFIANLISAVAIVARPARVVTSSATLNLSLADYRVGLSRSVAPAATTVNLPTGPSNGAEWVVEDLLGNFNAFPITFVAPGGTTFAVGGGTNYGFNEDFGSAKLAFYAANNKWTVRLS